MNKNDHDEAQSVYLIYNEADRRVLSEAWVGIHELHKDLWRTSGTDRILEKRIGDALGALWLLADHFDLDLEIIQDRANTVKSALKAEAAKKVC